MKRKLESVGAGNIRRATLALGLVAGMAAVDCAAQTAPVHVPLILYGRVHLSVERLQAGGVTAVERYELKNNTSRIGLRGSYDFGSDFYGFYQIESGAATDGDGLNAAGSSNSLAGRESFLGLGNVKAGSIKAGNFYHPYDDLHYISGNYWQLFTGTSNDATLWANGSNAATGGFDQRLANAVAYYTPNWNGFQGKVWYSLGGGNLGGGEEALGSAGSKILSLSLAYDRGPARLAWGYEQIKNARTMSNGFYQEGESHFITGGYTFGPVYLAGLYERDKLDSINTTGNNRSRDYWHVLAKYTIDKHAIGAWYGKAASWKGSAAIANSGAKMYTVGYSYAIHRSAGLYALYTKLENESSGAYVLGGSPARAATATADWTPARGSQPGVVLGGFINFQFPN